MGALKTSKFSHDGQFSMTITVFIFLTQNDKVFNHMLLFLGLFLLSIFTGEDLSSSGLVVSDNTSRLPSPTSSQLQQVPPVETGGYMRHDTRGELYSSVW